MNIVSIIKRLLVITVLTVLPAFAYAGGGNLITDSLVLRVFFPWSSSEIQPEFSGNSALIDEFAEKYNNLIDNDSIQIRGIRIHSYSSPEGNLKYNYRLRVARNNAVLQLLKNRLQISTPNITQIVERVKSKLPYEYQRRCEASVEYVVMDIPNHKHQLLLDSVAQKEPVAEQAIPVAEPEVVAPQEEPAPVVKDESVAVPQEVAVSEPVKDNKYMYRLSTNMLYDVMSVANVTFEFGFKEHWSVGMMVTTSLWNYFSPRVKFRNAFFVPEARYYFNTEHTRHYVGAQVHFGWYNFAFGGKTRYQDTDAKRPMVGFGLNYGYVMPLKNHWGLEFSAGLGYAYLDYDKFYNIKNGAQFGRTTRNYFGPTRLEVSVYYQF